MLGQTQLNRMYAASATSYGDCTNEDILRIIAGYPQKTFFQQIDEAQYSWGIYYEGRKRRTDIVKGGWREGGQHRLLCEPSMREMA